MKIKFDFNTIIRLIIAIATSISAVLGVGGTGIA